MRINQYANASTLTDSRVLLSDGSNGTKTVPISNLFYSMVDNEFLPVQMRNNIYRGKQIGTSVSSAQWTAISNGKFTDMFIGDYWEIEVDPSTHIKNNFRIAAFDYYYRMGTNNHHVVIVPDNYMDGGNVMASSMSGYTSSYGCQYCKTYIDPKLINFFKSPHVLDVSHSLSKTVNSSGIITETENYTCKSILMTEQNVFGAKVMGIANGGTYTRLTTRDNTQFPLFALDRGFINRSYGYWLRDICSNNGYCVVISGALAHGLNVRQTAYFRPSFCIG